MVKPINLIQLKSLISKPHTVDIVVTRTPQNMALFRKFKSTDVNIHLSFDSTSSWIRFTFQDSVIVATGTCGYNYYNRCYPYDMYVIDHTLTVFTHKPH